MGCVQQAVLEFDEEVRVPWRPRLVPAHPGDGAPPAPLAHREPSRRNPSRVGACRPPAPRTPRTVAGVSGEDGWTRSDRSPAHGTSAAPSRRPAGGAAGPGRPPVRLTRRARRLAVVLALGGGVVLGSWLAPLLSGNPDGGLHLAGVTRVVVEPGDTLWSIAASVADGEDVRVVVDRIQELNALDGSGLVPGQVLELP